MRKNKNEVHIIGYVYQSDEKKGLRKNTVKNVASANYGKEFISGEINVAVDEDGLNVIPVHFSYVTRDGNKKATFDVLEKIIEDKNLSWIVGGKDNAMKINISGNIGINDFMPQNSNEIVSTVRVEGGFAKEVQSLPENEKERHKFKTDMVINKITHIEADEEKKIDKDYVKVGGVIFNFKNEIIPVSYAIRDEKGMDYFESLDISVSNPVYTQVWGKINCMTIKLEKVTDSAFGEPEVQVYENKSKEYLITGCNIDPYDFGSEDVMTAEELKAAAQAREVKLAEIKSDSSKRSQTKKESVPTIAPKNNDVFDF